MDIKTIQTAVVGLAVLTPFLFLSCTESGAPTEPPHSPGTPDKPVLTAPEISTTGAYILRWSRPAGSVSYVLEEDLEADFPHPATVYTGPDSTARISGKVEGYIYFYRVRGYNANGSGQWSDLWPVRIIRGPSPNLVISSDTLEFGSVTVGQGRTGQILMSNSGSAALTITGASIDNPRFTLETVLPMIVWSGTDSSLDIRFVPTAPGTMTGTITVFSNDVDDYPPVVTLRGEGV